MFQEKEKKAVTERRKFALLIGVSQCVSGFKPLHCPPQSVQSFREILIDPEIGGFAPKHVISLTNPNVGDMRTEIADFFSQCNHHDLLLLYFTGHGVIDQTGDFFFTTCETRISENGILNRGTAVAAQFVRNEMTNSFSQRQVLILDCCFSGAFPDGVMAMGEVNLNNQLGGTGRAILTATNSTHYALEKEDEDLSIYTRYLLDGLKNGAAAPDGQTFIRVKDLHQYICIALQTAAASMVPQIYNARDGGDIVLAKAIIDSQLLYRKEVQRKIGAAGKFNTINRRFLNKKRQTWNIPTAVAEQIEWEVAQPYRERDENLQDFEETYREAITAEYPLSPKKEQDLKDYQEEILQLRGKDVEPIKLKVRKEISQNKPNLLNILLDLFLEILLIQVRGKILAAFVIASFITAIIFGNIVSEKDLLRASNSTHIPPGIDRFASFGEDILWHTEAQTCINYEEFTNLKKEGVRILKSNPSASQYKQATISFQKALNFCNDAPETLIYHNNAEISQKTAYNIAVSLPITIDNENQISESGNGEMMLRGFSQAQSFINHDLNGINGLPVRLLLIDDRDDSIRAKEIANILSSSNIVAVSGHWSSNTTLEAAKIYRQNKVPFIAPISITNELSGSQYRPFVFRINATSNKGAEALSNFYIRHLSDQHQSIAIFFDSSNDYTIELKDNFIEFLKSSNSSYELMDLDKTGFAEHSEIVNKILEENGVISLFPSNKSYKEALTIAQEARSKEPNIPILGDMANLYIFDTLSNQEIPDNIANGYTRGMVLAPAWNIDRSTKTEFVRQIREEKKYWDGKDVNYAAAMSYAALKSIAIAIKDVQEEERNPSRSMMVTRLVSEDFSVNGVFPKPLRFLKTGESNVEIQLVKVCPDLENDTHFEFQPIELGNPDCS